MTDWKNALIGAQTTIRDTIATIDAATIQIALVVDADNRLLGTVTDGDIRRGILRGVTLADSVTAVMNAAPTVAPRNQPREEILAMMRRRQLLQIPVVDTAGRVVGVEVLGSVIQSDPKPNSVVIMAGGLGSRLQPLTNDTPKPMLLIGGKPILETILEQFIDYGFSDFYFSVNYKAELIKQHFADGERWGVSIRYLEEDRRLGTAGALSLLPQAPASALIVMNGDVLTRVNFHHLLDFHAVQRAPATMCVREYDFQIPYGVVNIENHAITAIDEKPTQRFFVNAGIYVLEPETLSHIPADAYFDMPTLFKALIADGRTPAAFPLNDREYWADIGHKDDLERAGGDYSRVFRDRE